MTSEYLTFCTAVVSDLTASGRPLNGATTHVLETWSPEELIAKVGERHLAVWPAGEENVTPLATGAHELEQVHAILVWEPTPDADTRRVEDPVGSAAFFDLFEAVRARFYVTANQLIGGGTVTRVWYAGATFPTESGPMRYFGIRLDCRRVIAFS